MKEVDCGVKHHGVLEAIEHARSNLGLTAAIEHPLLGTKTRGPMANKDRIIGFTDSTGKKSWRIDFDPEKGLHVNATDYADKNAFRKVCHMVGLRSDQWTGRSSRSLLRLRPRRHLVQKAALSPATNLPRNTRLSTLMGRKKRREELIHRVWSGESPPAAKTQ